MTILASEIFDRVRRVAQDETSVRWPLVELRIWINDALREIVLQKPTASARTVVLPLVAGTYQSVPSQYISLLRVTRNLKTGANSPRIGGRAIRVVPRDILDAQHPSWHDSSVVPLSVEVKHVIFDPADPMAFYVYPGNTGSGFVEATVSANPTPVPLPALESDYEVLSAYAVPLDIQDVYANALLDYVLYRAYSKDAQYAGNAQRAAGHYQQFANSLGMKVKVDAVANPNVTTQAASV